MKKHSIDLRKYSRVFFCMRDHVEGTVNAAAGRQVPARFINLSEGGISFICDRVQAQHFDKGHVVTLKPKRAGILAFLEKAECEVRYVFTVECIPLATIGCEFMMLSAAALDKIRKIVGSKRWESK